MAKKWMDADNFFKPTEIKQNQQKFKKLMQEKPNFVKKKGTKKVYTKKEFIILEVSRGYVIYNTNKKFENGHTHGRTFAYAKSLIDLAIRKKLPHSKDKQILISLERISTDKKYIQMLKGGI